MPRSDVEVRVNDYNILLLKANIDIQYVAESSLALAHYVSGYVTKAEKHHLQDIWQKLVIVRMYTVDSGALALESVDCMKLAICYSVTTSMKSLRLSRGVSNHWNGIWNGTMEWKIEWNSEHTQLQLTRVTGAAQSRLNYLVAVIPPQKLHCQPSCFYILAWYCCWLIIRCSAIPVLQSQTLEQKQGSSFARL